MPSSDPLFSYAGANSFGLGDVGEKAHPTFVDIDNDRDWDAFIGNSDGNTLFFRNTGTFSHPLFAAGITNPFGLMDAGYKSYPTFADIDGDGDQDAFIGSYDMQFYRNIGTATTPIFAAPINNPFGINQAGDTDFVDIDGDGDLDAFVGDYDGYTVFFRNAGTANTPVFSTGVANPFGLTRVSPYNANPNFVDIDNDGDLDALLFSGGNYIGISGSEFFRNIGTVNNPKFYLDRWQPFGLSNTNQSSITFADLDGDHLLDIFSGNKDGSLGIFQNKGAGFSANFSGKSTSFGLDDISARPDPTFVDIDGDGDLDAFMGRNYFYLESGFGDTLFYKNIGNATNPIFTAPVTNPFGLINVGKFVTPTFVDIDKDGDLDGFTGNELGNTLFYLNTGTRFNPAFAAPVSNPFGLSDVGNYAHPTFVDIDNDMDLDLFINNLFFKNVGTSAKPLFAAPQSDLFGLSGGGNLSFFDTDKDGDLDAFKGSKYFKNIGTVNTPIFIDQGSDPFGFPQSNYFGFSSVETFADIDGDGDFDAYVLEGHTDYPSSGSFYINNTAPNISNLTVPENYTKNTPLNLKDIVISDSDSASVTATLMLSNVAAGKLSTATSGAVTSSYNATTGEWKASGAIPDVNALLAGVVFTPAINFAGAFSINASSSDDVAPALTGVKDFTVMLVSTPGNTVLAGTSSGNNTITYASATGAVTVSLNITTQQNTGGAGLDTITAVENLIGSRFADNLTGNSTYNILEGRAGNDILHGWSGADTLIGGLGDDMMYVENTRDAVTEKSNEGTDTVSSTMTYTLPVNVEKLILTGTVPINGTGNDLANVLTGNSAANQLNGQAGNDILNGGAGNDTLTGWSGADIMNGASGNDLYFVENTGDVVTESLNQGIDTVSSRLTYTLPANVENLTLTGTTAINGTGNGLANVMIGNAAANQLNGGAGNDILDGGLGMNRLTGGAGNDMFKFTSMGPVDVIADYNVANDTIQLENSVFTVLTTLGRLAAGQFRIGAQALDADDHVIYNSATGALIYDVNGNGAGGVTQIAVIGTGLGLTHADIVVI